MAQKGTISAMDSAATPLGGDEWIEIIQNGKNVRLQVSALLRAGADGKSAYDLAVERGETRPIDQWLASFKGDKGDRGEPGFRGDDGNDGSPGNDGADGKSIYQLMVDAGRFRGTLEEFLDEFEAKASGGGGGDTGGDTAQEPTLFIRVKSFTGEDYEMPAGVTIEKEYSDTSLRITHNRGMHPTGWFGFTRESDPWTAYVPTNMRNMQIVDENTIIMTSFGSQEDFDLYIRFS